VREAIEAVRPYAVDVCSGIEREPGRKDHARMREFFDALRSI
jgi:phosphoribosylanthranilate isomerase